METAVLLDTELETFEAHKAELVATHFLHFALVHGDEVSVYQSERDAVEEGYRRYGLVPFLVKQIVPVDAPLDFTSNMLA